jgi:hypothetical protein
MKATFEKSVAILIKAYLNDTLRNGSCHSCAVGNLVADGLDISVIRLSITGALEWSAGIPQWGHVVWQLGISPSRSNLVKASVQVAATGYSVKNLADIEHAFEKAYQNPPAGAIREDLIYTGLLAVVQVLAEIHQVEPTSELAANAEFGRAYQSRLTTPFTPPASTHASYL